MAGRSELILNELCAMIGVRRELPDMVGRSESMRRIMDLITRIAASRARPYPGGER